MNKNIMVLFMALSMVAGTTTLSPVSALGIGPGVSITVNLSVESADMNGDTFPGQWVELWKDGSIIQEGFTPFSADVKLGKEYQVFIYDDPEEGKFFDHWSNGSTDPMRTIRPLLDTYLTAFFQTDVISNNPPGAGDDFAETTLDTDVTIDVLANDFDPDGDDLFTDSIVRFADNGDVAINEDGTVTYFPFEGFVGTDSFEYSVSDGTDSDTAMVTVTVNG